MNIYKCAMINRPEGWNIGEVVNYDTLAGVSTLLWEQEIAHECKTSTGTVKVPELEIEVEKDTLDKLLKHYVIDLDEYNELYQADVDIITIV